MKTIVIACGTRPDVIKLAPVWEELRKNPYITTKIWWSGQGKDIFPAEYQYMLDESPTIQWESLNHGVSFTILYFNGYLEELSPDLVVVHGDDATAFACGLAAFNRDIPVAHVEAGLRTYQDTPFPEEVYRQCFASIASYHFCPDSDAATNLKEEGVEPTSIYIVGNTINDILRSNFPGMNGRLRCLATLHRRENSGESIQFALNELARLDEIYDTIVIKHPNWQGRYSLPPELGYIDPVEHKDLINLIIEADVVVTDSGGLQEECAFLGTPCVVYRDFTERKALLDAGAITLARPSDPLELGNALILHYDRRYAYGYGVTGESIAIILAHALDSGPDEQDVVAMIDGAG